MSSQDQRPAIAGALVFVVCLTLAGYFTFAAMQGDYGLFRRIEIEADIRKLEAEKSDLQARVARMENLTRRLSDSYLDLDLLDERARLILGYMRPDEIIIR